MVGLAALAALTELYDDVKEAVPPQLLPFQGGPPGPPTGEPPKDETAISPENETVTGDDLEPVPATEV
jgi:hypothetical protein